MINGNWFFIIMKNKMKCIGDGGMYTPITGNKRHKNELL